MADNSLFQSDLTEYVGTAAGHTIGMVIANVDSLVRELLHISEEYASLGILTSRTGAAAQAYAVDEAAKATNVELLIFELPRDTEGYSGHGNLIVFGARDVSDARRAVEIALAEIDKKQNTFILLKWDIWRCMPPPMPVRFCIRFSMLLFGKPSDLFVRVLPELVWWLQTLL